MKQYLFLLISCLVLFTACHHIPKVDKATTTDAQAPLAISGMLYTADLGQTHIEWIGSKPTGQHHGTFTLSGGQLSAVNNELKGGKFTIDINTLHPDDGDSENNAKLRAHLLDSNFFDAAKYPSGSFEITGVKAISTTNEIRMKDATHMVSGNLTLKGVTKNITFPAHVSFHDAQLMVECSFIIDRTQWGMSYHSDKSLGDKLIDADVNLQLRLVAVKP
ncbi:MAG: YceI family protein [Bacteroidota bacterium]